MRYRPLGGRKPKEISDGSLFQKMNTGFIDDTCNIYNYMCLDKQYSHLISIEFSFLKKRLSGIDVTLPMAYVF